MREAILGSMARGREVARGEKKLVKAHDQSAGCLGAASSPSHWQQ